MKIKNLFGIALLATISLCTNAQVVGGWQTPITTGTGGSSSVGTVTNLTGSNGITVTAGDPIVISQDGTLVTTNDLSAYALTNTVPPYSLFSTQSVVTLTPIPDTNTLYLRGGVTTTGKNANGTWIWNTLEARYTNTSLPASLRGLFKDSNGNPIITNSVSTNLYSKTGGFDGQYEVGVGSGETPAPFATFATNGFTTNYTLTLRETVDSWNLFGIVFNGGDGFPPTESQQQGHYIWSQDGSKWSGGTGGKMLTGVAGTIRDPALLDLGNRYILSYTTNRDATFSAAVPLHVSTNLNQWYHLTNIDFALSGETLVLASNRAWGPVFSGDGSNLWIHCGISTNNANSFEMRFRKTTYTQFPNGWTDTQRLTNSLMGSTHTNIIDFTPFYNEDDGRWYACYKNETTKYVEIGIFNNTPDTLFTPALTGDHAQWGSSVEGCWMTKLLNGKYRIFMSRYQGKDYGNNGTGENLNFAESTNLLVGWSRLTNCITPFYVQGFRPLKPSSVRAQTHAQAATIAGSGLVGRVNIIPEMTSTEGLYRHGWPFTNSGSISGINTNAVAGLNIGYGNFGQGMFGMGDGSLHLYTRTFNSADTNQFIFSYAKTFLRADSNSIAFNMTMPISGNFGSASNIPADQLTGSLSSNVLNGVRANFATGTVVTNLNTFGLTNTGTVLQTNGTGWVSLTNGSIRASGLQATRFVVSDNSGLLATAVSASSLSFFSGLSDETGSGSVVGAINPTFPSTITVSNGVILPPLVCTTATTNWSGEGNIITATNTTIFMSVTGHEGRNLAISRTPLNSAAGGQAILYCTNGSFFNMGSGTFSTNITVPTSGTIRYMVYGTNFIAE